MKLLYITILINFFTTPLSANQVDEEVEMNSGLVRSVYLNNIDVTSATNQKLKNVNVTIDSKGNIYIEGSQYQVTLENSYTPLQKAPEKKKSPMPKKISIENKKIENITKPKKEMGPFNEKGEPTAPAQDVAKP